MTRTSASMARLRFMFWNVFNLVEVGAVERATQMAEELEAKLDRIADLSLEVIESRDEVKSAWDAQSEFFKKQNEQE